MVVVPISKAGSFPPAELSLLGAGPEKGQLRSFSDMYLGSCGNGTGELRSFKKVAG